MGFKKKVEVRPLDTMGFNQKTGSAAPGHHGLQPKKRECGPWTPWDSTKKRKARSYPAKQHERHWRTMVLSFAALSDGDCLVWCIVRSARELASFVAIQQALCHEVRGTKVSQVCETRIRTCAPRSCADVRLALQTEGPATGSSHLQLHSL